MTRIIWWKQAIPRSPNIKSALAQVNWTRSRWVSKMTVMNEFKHLLHISEVKSSFTIDIRYCWPNYSPTLPYSLPLIAIMLKSAPAALYWTSGSSHINKWFKVSTIASEWVARLLLLLSANFKTLAKSLALNRDEPIDALMQHIRDRMSATNTVAWILFEVPSSSNIGNSAAVNMSGWDSTERSYLRCN